MAKVSREETDRCGWSVRRSDAGGLLPFFRVGRFPVIRPSLSGLARQRLARHGRRGSLDPVLQRSLRPGEAADRHALGLHQQYRGEADQSGQAIRVTTPRLLSVHLDTELESSINKCFSSLPDRPRTAKNVDESVSDGGHGVDIGRGP